MKFHLSSEISLEMIPEQYCHTIDMIEGLRQKRFENLGHASYKAIEAFVEYKKIK
jgi:hypothetical protein